MVHGDPSPGASPRAALEAAGWGEVEERLLGGLVHAFRGRATAIGGLARLLAEGDEGGDTFEEHMEGELERLQEAVEALALLAGDPAGEAEPLNPTEAAPPLLDLWARAAGEPLPVSLVGEGRPPPVRVSWPYFRRSFLLLLHRADGVYRARGVTGLRLTLEGEGNGAVFELGPVSPPEGGTEDAPEATPERSVREMDAVWRVMGGEVVLAEARGGEGTGFRARLPGLSVTR